MGASCSKPDKDVVAAGQRRGGKKKPQAQQPARPHDVDAACPIHGSAAHSHHDDHHHHPTQVANGETTAPTAERLLQGGAPESPVSTRFFTPGAGSSLALRTPATAAATAGGIPAEEQTQGQGQGQGQQLPQSCYARTKRGGIRKTGLQLLRPAQAYVVGEPATLKVEIRNKQAKPLGAGTRLLLLDNGFFAEAALTLPEIGAGETYTAELAAAPKRPTLGLKDLKGEVELRLLAGSELLMQQTFLLDALDFAGDLMPAVHAPSDETEAERLLNIYLLGGQGSGKTAFLQTLASVLLQTEPPVAQAPVPTAELDRVNFAKGGEESAAAAPAFFARPLRFRVFDLCGKDSERGAALDAELPGVLAGLAPVGFNPTAHSLAALSAPDRADLEATRAQRAADAALFFVSASEVEDPLKMESLKATFEAAKAALGGHAPLVVLGRADALEPRLAAEPLNWSSKKVATMRKRLATAFGVSWAQTFVAVPYAALPAKPPASVRSASAAEAGLDGSLSLSSSLKPAGATLVPRNFDVDRLALLLAGAALEAARNKAEGKVPLAASTALPATPKSSAAFTPASHRTFVGSVRSVGGPGSVKRLPTVDLSTIDGSFSSNFTKTTPAPATVIEDEHTEGEAALP